MFQVHQAPFMYICVSSLHLVVPASHQKKRGVRRQNFDLFEIVPSQSQNGSTRFAWSCSPHTEVSILMTYFCCCCCGCGGGCCCCGCGCCWCRCCGWWWLLWCMMEHNNNLRMSSVCLMFITLWLFTPLGSGQLRSFWVRTCHNCLVSIAHSGHGDDTPENC